MHNDQIDYTALRSRVETQLQKQRRNGQIALFLVNSFLFVTFMLVSWLVPRNAMNDSVLLGLLLLTIGWAVGVVMHGVSAFVLTNEGLARQIRRQLLAQEIRDAMLGIDDALLSGEDEKRKRAPGGRLRLSNEGELLDIIEDEWESDDARQQRRG